MFLFILSSVRIILLGNHGLHVFFLTRETIPDVLMDKSCRIGGKKSGKNYLK